MKLKFALFCSSWDALSDGILFSTLFLDFFWTPKTETMDYWLSGVAKVIIAQGVCVCAWLSSQRRG